MTTTTFAHYADALITGTPLPYEITTKHGADASPYEVLRALTPLHELRANGTFFTGQAMAEKLWGNALASLPDGGVIVDPTCGAGDLLLPAAVRSAGKNLTFRACDVQDVFASVASARLQAVVSPNARVEGRAADFTADQSSVSDAAIVVLNPPFVTMKVNEPWASGNTNSAAWFALKAAQAMPPGSRLLAVLPDVLRSGSRYTRWREHMTSEGRIVDIELLGQFDERTDVDVFRLELEIGAEAEARPWIATTRSETVVGDRFEVRVGPVVPHRDPEEGPLAEYITARSLSSGESMTRAFGGRLEQGPFVLIGRTSRPGQNPRVRAAYHASSKPAAIENHLLIAKPKDGLESTCIELIKVLQSGETVSFLDDRIRCRHLTVRAVKEIPW